MLGGVGRAGDVQGRQPGLGDHVDDQPGVVASELEVDRGVALTARRAVGRRVRGVAGRIPRGVPVPVAVTVAGAVGAAVRAVGP